MSQAEIRKARADAQRKRAAEWKAARKCVDCAKPLVASDGVRCASCAELARARGEAYRLSVRGRRKRNAAARRKYRRRVRAQVCVSCRRPASPGRTLCAAHLLEHATRQQEYLLRLEAGEVMPRSALVEHEQLELPLSTRVLRVARFYDVVTNVDVREHLGLPDEEGNNLSQTFTRLARKGLLERLADRRGSDAAYRLTEEGRKAA